MKRIVVMFIAFLWICANINSQELTSSQKAKITSEISALFEKNVKSNESLDVSELTESVSDAPSAGFINQGVYYQSFEDLMEVVNNNMRGIKSQKTNISNKKITVLSYNAALLTASGNYSVALEDGRTLTGGFAWTFVYSKINGKWKVIHSHMSNPQ